MTVRSSMKKMQYKKKIPRNTRKRLFRIKGEKQRRRKTRKGSKNMIKDGKKTVSKREKTPIEDLINNKLIDDNIIDGDLGSE